MEASVVDLSSKLITHGDNINYYKSVNHPIRSLSMRTGEHPGNFQNKSANSPFN